MSEHAKLRPRKTLIDKVYGDDTEAFLEDLLKDTFSDWPAEQTDGPRNSSSEPRKKDEEREQELAKPPPNVASKEMGREVKEEKPAKGEQVEQCSPEYLSSATSQRKWTRFPKRPPTPPEAEKEVKSEPKKSPGIKKSKSDNQEVLQAAELLRQMELENRFEDDEDEDFEDSHEKMENYLHNLRQDGMNSEGKVGESSRRTSTGSIASTSSSSSQAQNFEMRYLSVCTLEELIECKLKDVEKMSNKTICDSWMDDVELALLLIKKRSTQRNSVKSEEAKSLLHDILDQK